MEMLGSVEIKSFSKKGSDKAIEYMRIFFNNIIIILIDNSFNS